MGCLHPWKQRRLQLSSLQSIRLPPYPSSGTASWCRPLFPRLRQAFFLDRTMSIIACSLLHPDSPPPHLTCTSTSTPATTTQTHPSTVRYCQPLACCTTVTPYHLTISSHRLLDAAQHRAAAPPDHTAAPSYRLRSLPLHQLPPPPPPPLASGSASTPAFASTSCAVAAATTPAAATTVATATVPSPPLLPGHPAPPPSI